MNITTKFNIGDPVYIMHDNEIVQVEIDAIRISVKNGVFVWYDYLIHTLPGQSADKFSIRELKVFETKKELIQSL